MRRQQPNPTGPQDTSRCMACGNFFGEKMPHSTPAQRSGADGALCRTRRAQYSRWCILQENNSMLATMQLLQWVSTDTARGSCSARRPMHVFNSVPAGSLSSTPAQQRMVLCSP